MAARILPVSVALATSVALALGAVAAAADPVPSLNLRGWHAPTDPSSGMAYEPATTPGTWEWNVGVFGSYAFEPVRATVPYRDCCVNITEPPRAPIHLIRHQVTGDLVASVGFLHRFAVGFDLPAVIYQGGDTIPKDSIAGFGSLSLPAQAIGDLGIDTKLTLLRPTAGDQGGLSLAFVDRATVPTGSTTSFVGEGHVTNETRLLGEYRLGPVAVFATAGFLARGHSEGFVCAGTAPSGPNPYWTGCRTQIGSEVPFGVGFTARPQAFGWDPAGRMTWFLELHGHVPAHPIGPFQSAAASNVELDLASRFALPQDLSILAGIGTSLNTGLGDARVHAVLSFSWAPRAHDRDGDGIPDDVDQCPDLPEDKDGFEDDDGCPDLDNDDDGIPDSVDKCPNEKEDVDGFQDDDGCPDLDNDQDGIADTEDACPNTPGPRDADPKKNGCPAAIPRGRSSAEAP